MSTPPNVSPHHEFTPPIFAGSRVTLVGKLGAITRKEAREFIRNAGGLVVDKLDPSVSLIVVGADVDPLNEPDELLEDWVVTATRLGNLEVIDEVQFLKRLGIFDQTQEVDHLYTPAMLASLLSVPISTIRRWHRRGLITPTKQAQKLPYFDFQEVASARRLAQLIESGETPQTIEKKLLRLKELYPALGRPLSQLSVIIEGRHVLLRQGGGLIEPNGQRRIDFDLLDESSGDLTSVVTFDDAADRRSIDQLTTPAEFVQLAISFEDEDDPESAIEVYRAMALAFGPTADTNFRIAELLYQLHQLAAARERYYMAVEMDESFVEARASLGCVLVELDEKELALSAFHGALQHHADYPDVHFHLARLLDELDQEETAEKHWEAFLQLAPKSPWADEARQRLNLA